MPKGDKAPAGHFTGTVWLYPLATDTLAHWSIAKVTFKSGARSNRHFHPDKQVLVIIEGVGYLKEKGKPIQKLHKGDVVTIQPGVDASLLKPYGNYIQVGMPAKEEVTINNFAFNKSRVKYSTSLIGGIPQTQEGIGYCAEYKIYPQIQV